MKDFRTLNKGNEEWLVTHASNSLSTFPCKIVLHVCGGWRVYVCAQQVCVCECMCVYVCVCEFCIYVAVLDYSDFILKGDTFYLSQ